MCTRRNHQYRKTLRVTAEQLGFTVSPTSGGHQVARHTSGARVFFTSSPSSPRGYRNAIAQLRRTVRLAAGGAP